VLQITDSLRVTFGVGKIADQDREVHHRPEHAPGGAVEQVEERELTGDDLKRHRYPFPPEPMAERRYRAPGKVSTR
jgi:hypothetical protein